MRRCGQCTLCCRLLPQAEIAKPAGMRCVSQRHTGCAVYSKRPHSCREWSCRWLLEMDTADLRRPDFAHYVLDLTPDFVTIKVEGGDIQIPVVQVWVDPRHRDAHRDPALREYLARRGEEQGMAALIRYDSHEGFVIFPPALTNGRGWIENYDGVSGEQHTAEQLLAVAPDLLMEAVTATPKAKEMLK